MSLTPRSDYQDELATKVGFVARTRKAFVAGVSALAAALSPALIAVSADGVLSVDEVVPVLVTAVGFGLAAFVGVYAIKNEGSGDADGVYQPGSAD